MSAQNPLQPTTDPYTADSASSVETPARTTRRRRRLGLLAAAGLAPVLVAGTAVAASAHKSVDLEVNGETQTVSTFAGSVGGLLEEQGITIDERDLVAPGEETALTSGDEIVVRDARQVTVTVNGEPQVVWTTALSQGELVSTLFESGRSVTMASRSLERPALGLPLVVDADVDVVADGATERVHLDGSATVADALDAAGVTTSETDRVDIGASEDGTVKVTVTRVVAGERTETEAVDFTTVERKDDSLYQGQTKVVQEGKAGERTRTYAILTVGGEEVTAALRADEVTTAPADRVVAVGTKERPAAAPAPAQRSAPAAPAAAASTRAPAPAPSAPAAPTGGVWAALAQCESGGNPGAVSANGLYYGLYQFSLGTWAAMGGSGLPSQASPAEQTQRAQALQARSGWGQWPACSAKLGLR